MEKIIIPSINNNETEAKLSDWLVKEGELVKIGQVIASLETTKATYEIEAVCEGYVQKSAEVSKKYEFGKSIGIIFATKEEYEKSISNLSIEPINNTDSFLITEPAKKLIELHNISYDKIESLGLSIIKAVDLEKIINGTNDIGLIELSMRQQAIAKTVVQSKNTIPDAFLLKKINISNVLDNLAKYSSENNTLVGLSELLVLTLSRLFDKFPYFFASIYDDKHIKLAQSANIGVTIDVGKGLFIPVIPEVNLLPLDKISEYMMIFRMKALRENFNANELSGGNISISLNIDSDTIFVKPIIFPGHACMLSVGAVFKEIILTDDNKLNINYFFNLGLSYDHRMINGYEANCFLTELKILIENPDFKS